MMEEQKHPLLPNAFAEHNGIQYRVVGPEQAEATLEVVPDSLNPYGLLHGGAYYTLADCACGCDETRYVALFDFDCLECQCGCFGLACYDQCDDSGDDGGRCYGDCYAFLAFFHFGVVFISL